MSTTPGICTVPPETASAPPHVQSIAVDPEDLAIGVLEHAAVGIETGTRIERRQELGRRKLPQGDCFHHALLGQENLRILHTRQPQGTRQVDRRDVCFEILL